MSLAILEAPAAPIRFAPHQALDVMAPVAPLKTLCSNCHLRELCLPCGMAGSDVARLDSLMFARRRVKSAQALYHQGEHFQFVYAVRSGTFKFVTVPVDPSAAASRARVRRRPS